uniref:Uncharacterized protein n=1 Tax=Romanomermis culicivorax TaxID=13658 RepID=A0A915IEI6_ROMCU
LENIVRHEYYPYAKKVHEPEEVDDHLQTDRVATAGLENHKAKVTVDRFPQNCSYPFRPKVDLQAERFKLLAIRSVPSKKASPNSDALKTCGSCHMPRDFTYGRPDLTSKRPVAENLPSADADILMADTIGKNPYKS